jgi:hypothetical protein
MSKVITLRLSDEEYQKISYAAHDEHRPISNFITALVLKDIAESYFVDPIEMNQIRSDKKLILKLQRGHGEAKKLKGKLLG